MAELKEQSGRENKEAGKLEKEKLEKEKREKAKLEEEKWEKEILLNLAELFAQDAWITPDEKARLVREIRKGEAV